MSRRARYTLLNPNRCLSCTNVLLPDRRQCTIIFHDQNTIDPIPLQIINQLVPRIQTPKPFYPTIQYPRLGTRNPKLLKMFRVPPSDPWSTPRLAATITMKHDMWDVTEESSDRRNSWVKRVRGEVDRPVNHHALEIGSAHVDDKVILSGYFGEHDFRQRLGAHSWCVERRGGIRLVPLGSGFGHGDKCG